MSQPTTATTTTNSSQTLPAWVTAAQQNLVQQGQNITNPFLAVPAYQQPGLTADQNTAMTGYENLYNNLTQNPFPTGQAQFNAAQFGGGATAQQAVASQAQAAQVDPSQIQQFMNPYEQNVLDSTFKNMQNQENTANANTGAQFAAAGAYGGSRQAVAQSLNQQNFMSGVAQTASQLMAQGYSQAQAVAMANAQMQQQTNLANAQAQNSASQSNASLGTQAALSNSQMLNNVNLQNAQMANTMGLQNANNQLNSYSQQFNLTNNALSNLMNSGTTQQTQLGNTVNAPYTALQRLLAVTPSLNNTGYTATGTSTQPLQNNTLGTILGAALTGLSSYSDENEKVNKQKLGKDPKTGLDMYAYDYKDDVEKAKKSGKPMPPKRVGPMAQDIEKKSKGSTATVGGKKVVKGGALAKLMNVNDDDGDDV